MKLTLALLVYVTVLSPAQVESLPPELPPGGGEARTPGLKVPLPEPKGPAGLATPQSAPRAPAVIPPPEAPPLSLPLKVPLPEPKGPANLAPPRGEKVPALPPPVEVPPPAPELCVEGPPRPVPCVPCPPLAFPCPSPCACQQKRPAPSWEQLRAPLRPAGSSAGYFVVQDVHGFWPVTSAGLPVPTAPPPLAPESAPPVVRASSHPLPPAQTLVPVIYTSKTAVPKVAPAAPPAEKVVIVLTTRPKEVVWGARDEYRKIVGQLVRVHVHGGRWVVRYAGLDKEDRYGGSIVLDPSADLGKCVEGDIVCVQGEILNGGRAERPLGAPLYRVQAIQRLGGGRK